MPANGIVRWIKDVERHSMKKEYQNEMGVEFIKRPTGYLALLRSIVEEQDKSLAESSYENVFKVNFANLEDFMEEYTNNISQGGMFVATQQVLPAESPVDILIMIADILKIFSIKGRVVQVVTDQMQQMHGLKPGLGIQLTSSLDLDKEVLVHYLSEMKTPSE